MLTLRIEDLKFSLYVDDLISGSTTVRKAREMKEKAAM